MGGTYVYDVPSTPGLYWITSQYGKDCTDGGWVPADPRGCCGGGEEAGWLASSVGGCWPWRTQATVLAMGASGVGEAVGAFSPGVRAWRWGGWLGAQQRRGALAVEDAGDSTAGGCWRC